MTIRFRALARMMGAAAVVVWLPALSVHAAGAPKGMVRVRRRTVTRELKAYAQVVPRSLLPVRATLAGTIAGLTVEPGDTVQAGELLARLTGPQPASLLAERQAAAHRAQTALTAATQLLAIARQQRHARLSTRQDVIRAEAEKATARITS